jgi:hypothetical protein
MKKTITLLITALAGSLGYFLYKKNETPVVDERSLARDNNDYMVYHDDNLPKSKGDELFV